MALWKKLGLAAALVALFIGGCGVIITAGLSVPCVNEILAESQSPDKERKFVVFERSCGATTDFSTQVSILDGGEILPDEPGNAFSADTNHGAAPSGIGGGPEVRINWLSNQHAQIEYHSSARTFRTEPSVKGVQVSYATFN